MGAASGAGLFPLLRLLAGQAPLLVEHAEAYAELAAEEVTAAVATARRRLVAFVACLLAGLFAIGFGGVALMLWGALPPEPEAPARWLLWLVPLACAIGALVAAKIAQSQRPTPVFAELKSQWRQDVALLHEGMQR
ncbi:MAG TPA: hypothetical protein VFR90_00445 [Methylibium sp.]|uniref:hypothetical protein n=1 Tax=Methylibium sp. TaxID=2067992 RepID=UPI002DB7DE76|nr:hypothetical protein [Methylibium sp.]HEU4457573.1 hypothetical protein [Methylibium sp.]